MLCLLLISSSVAENSLVYIGGNTILNLGGLQPQLLHLNRDAIGSCFPFSDPVDVAVASFPRSGVTYLGGEFLFARKGSSFDIIQCSANFTDSTAAALSCQSVFSGSMNSMFGSSHGKVAYIETDKMFVFNETSGDYRLYGFEKAGICASNLDCQFTPSLLLSGNFREFCDSAVGNISTNTGYRVASVGFNSAFLSCRGTDGFVVLALVPSPDADIKYIAYPSQFGSGSGVGEVLTLGGNLIMRYNKSDLSFEILNCFRGKCAVEAFGSIQTGSPCQYRQKETCISDPRCGFCEDKGMCMQSGQDGPCGDVCQQWRTKDGLLPALTYANENYALVEERQYVYIADDIVLHYGATNGDFKMLSVVSNIPQQLGRCPGVISSPLYKGQMPFKYRIASPFGPRSVIFHDPSTGDYAVWYCEGFTFERNIGLQPPCTFISTGSEPLLIGADSLLWMNSYSLVVYSNKGMIRALNQSQPNNQTEKLFHTDIFSGVVSVMRDSSWTGHSLFSIGMNYVFDLDVTKGIYRVWLLDPSQVKLLGPGDSGRIPPEILFHMRWMGDDRLLAVDYTSGDYLLLRFDATALGTLGVVPLITIGRGSFDRATCKYSNCSDCTADPKCGWCSSQNKCIPGNEFEPCNDGTSSRCVSWMYGYCAVSSCYSRQYRSQCIVDGLCGWCETSGLCVPLAGGISGVPSQNQCPGGNVTLTASEYAGDHHN